MINCYIAILEGGKLKFLQNKSNKLGNKAKMNLLKPWSTMDGIKKNLVPESYTS